VSTIRRDITDLGQKGIGVLVVGDFGWGGDSPLWLRIDYDRLVELALEDGLDLGPSDAAQFIPLRRRGEQAHVQSEQAHGQNEQAHILNQQANTEGLQQKGLQQEGQQQDDCDPHQQHPVLSQEGPADPEASSLPKTKSREPRTKAPGSRSRTAGAGDPAPAAGPKAKAAPKGQAQVDPYLYEAVSGPESDWQHALARYDGAQLAPGAAEELARLRAFRESVAATLSDEDKRKPEAFWRPPEPGEATLHQWYGKAGGWSFDEWDGEVPGEVHDHYRVQDDAEEA
jgi:hypothetical protein